MQGLFSILNIFATRERERGGGRGEERERE